MKSRRKRSLMFLLALMVILSNLQSFSFFTQKASAAEITSKVPEGFIGIYTPEDLTKVRDNLNGNYIVMNDIDLSKSTSAGGEFYHDGYGWDPIGTEGNPFTGIFDGNGFEISGLYIKDRTGSVGLFGAVRQAIFKNIGIVDGSITVDTTSPGSTYYGGLVGKATDTSIEKSYSGVNIAVHLTDSGYGSYSSFIGGLVGHMTKSTINNSFGYGNISVKKTPAKSYYTTSATAGTLAGIADSYSAITNSYSIGRLAVFAKSYDGSTGVLSKGYPKVTNSYYLKDNRAQPVSDSRAKTLEEMLVQSAYEGFDFENVWMIAKESGYPFPKFNSNHIQPKENTTAFAGGMGTAFSPYKIASAEQLKAVKSHLNSYFELVNDIDLSGFSSWDPIGTLDEPFTGSFNGKRHSITGLTINLVSDKELAAGLFGYVTYASIQDVGVVNGNIQINRGSAKESIYTGGIAGHLKDSRVKGVFTDHQISASARYYSYTGGIAGYLSNSEILNSYNLGNVYSNSGDYSSYVGGVTGLALDSSIAEVYNSGNINGSANFYGASSGGIVGALTRSRLNDSYNLGNVHASSWSGTPSSGALSGGASGAEVSNSYSIGKVDESSLDGSFPGSLIGSMNETVVNSSYYFNNIDYQGETANDLYLRTKEELQLPSTFEGFDFNTVWKMGGNPEYLYPVLDNPDFAVPETVENIKFKSLPTKLIYQEGEELDLSGAVLVVKSNFLREYDVIVAPDMLSGHFNPYQPGEQRISISYGNFSIDLTVTVVEKDRTAPIKPTVNEVTDKTTIVTGRAEPDSTLEIKVGSVLVRKATTKADGKFAVSIPAQKAGTQLIITAMDKAGNVSEKAIVMIKPSVPTGLTVSSNSYNSVKASWKGTSGISGYEIWRATSSTGTYKKIKTTSNSSYINTSLNTGTTYYYKVRAYKTGTSTLYSSFSPVVSAKPIPVTPASVKAASSSYSSIKTSWAAVSGASGYQVYRATSSMGTYSLIGTTISTSFNNSGLITNKLYYYKVRAYRMAGGTKVYSNFSTVVSAKPIPSVPTNFKVSRSSSTSLKLIWSRVFGASGYEIYRSTSKSGAYSLLKRTTSLYYTNSRLTTGRTYYYKLRAYRTVGTAKIYSGWTTVIGARP
ncbi:Ig-like domain-containing protein [Peribacillus asahii]|uniref:Ig-like domain-containing protein n=1 Tax=Peribacillus asahii TaxID=228899 RepID=UPI0037FF96E1